MADLICSGKIDDEFDGYRNDCKLSIGGVQVMLPFSCDGTADAVAKPHTAIELEMSHGTDYPGHFADEDWNPAKFKKDRDQP